MPRSFYANEQDVEPVPGSTQPLGETLRAADAPHHAAEVEGMVVRSLPTLERLAHLLRLWVHGSWELAKAEWGTQKLAAANEWASVQASYLLTVVEPLLPLGIYILTGMLAGLVAVARRLLPVRFVVPTAVGVAVFSQTMPQTFQRVRAVAADYELQYPEVVAAHNQAIAGWTQAVEGTKQTRDASKQLLVEAVGAARRWVVLLVE